MQPVLKPGASGPRPPSPRRASAHWPQQCPNLLAAVEEAASGAVVDRRLERHAALDPHLHRPQPPPPKTETPFPSLSPAHPISPAPAAGRARARGIAPAMPSRSPAASRAPPQLLPPAHSPLAGRAGHERICRRVPGSEAPLSSVASSSSPSPSPATRSPPTPAGPPPWLAGPRAPRGRRGSGRRRSRRAPS